MTNTANTVTTALTSDQEEEVTVAYRTLHEVVRSLPEGKAVGDFHSLSLQELGAMVVLAHRALTAAHKAREDAKAKEFQDRIAGVLNTHITAHRETVSQFNAELEKLSPVMRQVVEKSGAAPDPNTVRVPVSELVPCFEQGTTVEQVAKQLVTFGLKVGKRGEESPYVKLDLTGK